MPGIKFEPLIIQTDRHRITGTIAVPSVGRNRLSDYANDPDREFFSITDAKLAPLDAPDQVEELGFLLVARRSVVLVTPGPGLA